MKNFRKVLALILVVATLFSFTAMASAKTLADYSDADKVSYDAAVDVLSAIGILNGYTDGTFQPTSNIRRDEMAKMVAVLSNAGDDVSQMYASACTFADSKTNWAASYIAYCGQTGIIAGRSATTFDPEANVTGLETAKMLLCVLGLDAKEQGYVGANWAVNVMRDAKSFGLLNGFAEGWEISKAITREEAANMFLNALTARLVVGTLSDNVITISNAAVVSLSKDGQVLKVGGKVTLLDAKKYGWVDLYGNVIVSDNYLWETYKGLTCGTGIDCYGRPAAKWSITNDKGVETWSAVYPYGATAVYNDTVDFTSVLRTEYALGTYKLNAYVDGDLKKVCTEAFDAKDSDMADLCNKVRTGKGIRTELYINDTAKTIDVVVINTRIDQIGNVSARYNTFELNGYTFSNATYGFSGGEMVLYWLCSGNNHMDDPDVVKGTNANQDVVYLHLAKVVEPTVATVSYVRYNASDRSENMFTADGKDYYYAANYGWTIDTGLNILKAADKGDTKDIYLDLDGNVMYVTKHVVTTPVYYGYVVEDSWKVTNWTETTSAGDNRQFFVDMVDYDDEAAPHAVSPANVETDENMVNTISAVADYTAYGYNVGRLVAYTLDSNGVVHIVMDKDTKQPVVAEFCTEGAKLGVAGVESNVIDAAKGVYADNATKYIVRTYDYSAQDYVYKTFTGYRNIDQVYYASRVLKDKQVIGTSIQYFATSEGVATYVFIDATYSTNADTFFVLDSTYMHAASWVELPDALNDYHVYYALVNGEKSLVAIKGMELAERLYLGGLTAINVNLTVEGENVPLYVYTAPEAPTWPGMEDYAVKVGNGIVWLTNADGTVTPENVSVNGLTVYTLYGWSSGSGFDKVLVEENVMSKEYDTDCTWVLKDGTGVYAIYRIEY